MAVAWTDITNAQVAAGAPLTTALVTALRDNVEGIAQRASGAPKIFGVPYDFQEFTSSGTWTKPSQAEAGDVVIVHVVGGGGGADYSGGDSEGGGGGGGIRVEFEDIDIFGATEAVVVGAGGAGGLSDTDGADGGDSSFGTAPSAVYLKAYGGEGAVAGFRGDGGLVRYLDETAGSLAASSLELLYEGGDGATTASSGAPSICGGGGGCGGRSSSGHRLPGLSLFAGRGGVVDVASPSTSVPDGQFPGGGGGGNYQNSNGDGGSGGDGVVRVWCMKRN